MKTQRHIRSYVKRNGRLTKTQKLFLSNNENNINFFTANKLINYQILFDNNNPCVLDIGFGNGELLINIAKKFPKINFIGIEVYESGIINILKQISCNKLNNIKITNFDAVEFLRDYIRDKSLHGISLFFPDPWPKKKHYKRRIINTNFINLVNIKIKKGGFIKIATDWSNYGNTITELFNNSNDFEIDSDIFIYKNRCLTKFEKKGIGLSHRITELSYRVK